MLYAYGVVIKTLKRSPRRITYEVVIGIPHGYFSKSESPVRALF